MSSQKCESATCKYTKIALHNRHWNIKGFDHRCKQWSWQNTSQWLFLRTAIFLRTFLNGCVSKTPANIYSFWGCCKPSNSKVHFLQYTGICTFSLKVLNLCNKEALNFWCYELFYIFSMFWKSKKGPKSLEWCCENGVSYGGNGC